MLNAFNQLKVKPSSVDVELDRSDSTAKPENVEAQSSLKDGFPPKFRANKKFRYVGSAQFTEEEFHKGIEFVRTFYPKAKFADINCRAEPHFFINKVPMCAVKDVDHAKYMQQLMNCSEVHATMDEEGTFLKTIKKDKLTFEQDFVEKADIEYINLPIVNHGMPTERELDLLTDRLIARHKADQNVNFEDENAPQNWLWIHCAGGKSRTSIIAAVVVLFELYLINQLDITSTPMNVLQGELDPQSYNRIFKKLKAKSCNSLTSLLDSPSTNTIGSLSPLTLTSQNSDIALSPYLKGSSRQSLESIFSKTDQEDADNRLACVELFFDYLKDLIRTNEYVPCSRWLEHKKTDKNFKCNVS